MDRIERSRNPLSRLQVVQPIKHEPLKTASQIRDDEHWSRIGRWLTAALVVGSAIYVAFNLGRLPW